VLRSWQRQQRPWQANFRQLKSFNIWSFQENVSQPESWMFAVSQCRRCLLPVLLCAAVLLKLLYCLCCCTADAAVLLYCCTAQVDKGTPVAIYAEDKQHAMAVGLTIMSTQAGLRVLEGVLPESSSCQGRQLAAALASDQKHTDRLTD